MYGDQVYDVLGDAQIDMSLRELLMRAIASDEDPAHVAWMDEVIDEKIGRQMKEVLDERALMEGLADPAANDKIRRDMEIARARRLQPWFVESFFMEALRMYGGRIAGREQGRYEITRVPAAVRVHAEADLGPVHDRYERVTFDKAHIQPSHVGEGPAGGSVRADLISPGTPLLAAIVNKVMADLGGLLQRGAVLVDEGDSSTDPRLLVYLDHTITDGREVHGARQVVSRRFHYVEIDRHGATRDPGDEPYLNYAPLTDEQQALLNGRLDVDWAGRTAEDTARSWAIEHLAGPHFDEVAAVTHARVEKVWDAVRQRLESEIRYWDQRTEEIKTQEIKGKKPRLNSGRARARADELQTRLARRRLELAQEDDLHNSPPTIVAAAVVVPQGLLDKLAGRPISSVDPTIKAETDRRAVAAVMKAERKLGRVPEEQHHSNPGYDVLSTDPVTQVCYFIEVKGHLPQTEQISVSRRQVGKAHNSPERWRLAVVSVPEDPDTEPDVHYLIEPFKNVSLHPAQTSIPLNVAELLVLSGPPR